MKKLLLILLLCCPAFGAAWTSQQSGDWSRTSDNADSPWYDGGVQTGWASVPANTDTVTIANTHDVAFDVDQSGFAAGITLTINDGGKIHASTSAGSYYLKCQANLTLNGTLQAGTSTSVPYPSTCTFTISFASGARSIERSSTAHIYLYCTQPTNKYIVLTDGEPQNETTIVVGTDVTSDWAAGSTVCIVDSTPKDVEYVTAATINAGNIVISGGGGAGGGLDSAVSANSIMTLVTRNIRIINVAASDYAVTYPDNDTGSGDYIGAEISSCYRGINLGYGWNFAGTTNLLTTSPNFAITPDRAEISGVITGNTGAGTSFSSATNSTLSGLAAGLTYGVLNGSWVTTSGRIFGCTIGLNSAYQIVSSTGIIDYCTTATSNIAGMYFYGIMRNCTSGFYAGNNYIISGILGSNTNYDLGYCDSGKAYNTQFNSATEFGFYSSELRSKTSYFESFDHDQVENSFKAWCRGGVVTSQTASPPSGYTLWYKLTAEDITQTYPVFRQYQTTVLPGGVLEVSGYFAIPNGEDLSTAGLEPQLQIIDAFADPLVDSTQTPLDYDLPADCTGATTTWQAVDVVWANQGDAPRQVIVRMIAYNDGGADDVDVSSAWAIATYQDQIATLYNNLIPVKTAVAGTDTTTSFTLAAGQATADVYNNMTVMVQDATDAHWELRSITDWTAGRVITVDTAFGFTPDIDDDVYIMATSYGAPVDTAAIADAVWDEAVADHTTETSFGGEVGGLDPNLTFVLADTSELQTDWTNGGRLDVILDAIKAITDILPAISTTIASPNDMNNFTLTAGIAVADAYNGMTIYIQDADDSHWESRLIIDYTAGRVVDVDEPFGFVPAAGDVVYLWGQAYFPMDIWDSLPIPLPEPKVNAIDVRAARPSGEVGGTKVIDWEGIDP